MLSQRVDFTIVPLQFDLGEERVHLPVTDPVQAHRMQAATRSGHEMMGILLLGRNRAVAQWTNREHDRSGLGRPPRCLLTLDASLHRLTHVAARGGEP